MNALFFYCITYVCKIIFELKSLIYLLFLLTFSFDASLYFFQFVTGDEPTTMHNDTTDLIDLMIEDTKGRAIYLAVREIGDKTRSSQTINVLKRHPEILDFTLGVYTKCDDLVTRKIKLKMEEKTDLRHGYVATMNAPPSTHSSHNSLESNDLFIQANEEINYFKDNNLSHLLEKKLATCNVLVDKVGDMYHTHLLETWIPTTLALIYQKNRKLEEQDKLMGLPRGHILNETTTPIVRILVAKVSVSIVAKVHAEQEDRLFNTVLVPLETSLIKMLSDYINAVKKEVQYFKSSTTNGEKKKGEENGQEKNKSQILIKHKARFDIPTIPGIIFPVNELKAAEGFGFVNVDLDHADNTVRYLPLLASLNGKFYPSFVLELVRVFEDDKMLNLESSGNAFPLNVIATGFARIPVTKEGNFILHNGMSDRFPTLSISKIIDGSLDKQTLIEMISNKILIVGSSASGLNDLHASNIEKAVPGPLIQLSAVHQILSERYLKFSIETDVVTIALLIFALITLFFVSRKDRINLGLLITIGVGMIFLWVSYHLFREEGFITNLLLLFTFLISSLTMLLLQSTFVALNKRALQTAFGAYLAPEMVKEIEFLLRHLVEIQNFLPSIERCRLTKLL